MDWSYNLILLTKTGITSVYELHKNWKNATVQTLCAIAINLNKQCRNRHCDREGNLTETVSVWLWFDWYFSTNTTVAFSDCFRDRSQWTRTLRCYLWTSNIVNLIVMENVLCPCDLQQWTKPLTFFSSWTGMTSLFWVDNIFKHIYKYDGECNQ